MKRVLPVLTLLAAATFVAGCSALSTPVARSSPTRVAASDRSVSGAITGAMASCGLFPGDDGVVLGKKAALALTSEPDGKPTNVDAITTRCTLSALGLPAKDGAVFDAAMATGGYQTLQWGRWSASEHVTDTLHFEVDVFSTGS